VPDHGKGPLGAPFPFQLPPGARLAARVNRA
jgi:hypothetical protein